MPLWYKHATQVAGTNMLVSQAYMSALPLHLSACL